MILFMVDVVVDDSDRVSGEFHYSESLDQVLLITGMVQQSKDGG